MSQPQSPKPAKLVAGFFVKDKAIAADIARELQDRLGPMDMVSAWLNFDFTTYYEKEMGGPLYRRLIVFKTLIEQTRLSAIKRATNDLEEKYRTLKIAKTIEGSKEDRRDTKLKINALIREVDACISQLSE